jgi:hypothetical protein
VLGARGKSKGAINISVFKAGVSREELIDRYMPALVKTARNLGFPAGVGRLSAR